MFTIQRIIILSQSLNSIVCSNLFLWEKQVNGKIHFLFANFIR